MAIRVVTIDFWNTLFDSSGGPTRNEARRSALQSAIAESGLEYDPERLKVAYEAIWGYFDHHWLNLQRTPTSMEMVREIYRQLDLSLAEDLMERVADVFSLGVLEHPPALLPGVREGLAYLSQHADIALISDTAFSPGAVLRTLMERNGIAHYFAAYSFSDETGFAKPHPEAFRRALAPFEAAAAEAVHIGDIERTDIVGAKRAGMRTVLYKGDNTHKYAEEETGADMILPHWSDVATIFAPLFEG